MENITFQELVEKFNKTKQELLESKTGLQYLIGLGSSNSPHDNNWYENKFDKYETREPDDKFQSKFENKFNKYENYEPDEKFQTKFENKFNKYENYEPDEKFQSKKLDNSFLSEDGGDNSDGCSLKNCSMQSAIVKKITHSRSRRDAIRKQNVNARIKSRNRRILGMLQCTLKKFQVEAIKRKCQDMKRIKIERKVEAAQIKEKEQVNEQIIELRKATKQKLFQLDCLEKMMDLVKLHELWKENQSHLLNFMTTDAEPKIFFLPTRHTESSKKFHKESQQKILEIIEKHDTKVKELLLKYENADPSEFTKDEKLEQSTYRDHTYRPPDPTYRPPDPTYRPPDEKDNSESLGNTLVPKVRENGHANNYSASKKRKISNALSMQLKKYACI